MNNQSYRQIQFDSELKAMLAKAQKNGKSTLSVISKDLHDRVVQSGANHRMPTACNAMWEMWKKQGSKKSKIIHSTDSDKSSTIQIEFDTDWRD